MTHHTKQRNDFIFTWKIENFNFHTLEIDEYLESPEFKVKVFNSTSWRLRFYPDYLNCTYCYLFRTDVGPEKIHITYRIELMTDEGKFMVSSKNVDKSLLKNNRIAGEACFKLVKTSNASSVIVRCFMSEFEAAARLTTKCKAKTKFGVDRYSFRWIVNMFKDPSWTENKVFSYSETEYIEVTLTAPKDTALITIKKERSEDQLPCRMTCQLYLLDVKNVQFESEKYVHLWNTKDTWKFPTFVTKDKLLSDERKFLTDGTFNLMFEFCVSNGNKLEMIEGYYHQEYFSTNTFADVETIAALQEDLRRLRETHLRADVKLRAENQTFQAHKLLLSVRSTVFAAMFEQDMLENQTGIVDIPDVEAEILNRFLGFLYTGVVDNMDYECATKLLIVADKYQVFSLREKCSSFLMSNLTNENACVVVMLADMIGHDALKACTVDYITSHAETILCSDGWEQCIQKNLKLATHIFRKLTWS